MPGILCLKYTRGNYFNKFRYAIPLPILKLSCFFIENCQCSKVFHGKTIFCSVDSSNGKSFKIHELIELYL